MKRNNKRALYESIMKDVGKIIKKHLNESQKYYIDYYDEDGDLCNTYVKANSEEEAEEKAYEVYDDIVEIVDIYTDRNEVRRRFMS